MSDYFDSDYDDVVLVRPESPDGHVFRTKSVTVRGRASSSSRYGARQQSELERHMFSWTLQDVLNKNLLKKKVSICFFFAFPFSLFIKQKRNAYTSFLF
jgi:senataxin